MFHYTFVLLENLRRGQHFCASSQGQEIEVVSLFSRFACGPRKALNLHGSGRQHCTIESGDRSDIFRAFLGKGEGKIKVFFKDVYCVEGRLKDFRECTECDQVTEILISKKRKI